MNIKNKVNTQDKPLWQKPLYLFALFISLLAAMLWGIDWYNQPTASMSEHFSYLRVDIDRGQVWRLITGNLLHTNLWHLVMNLAGLWVILFLHEMHYKKQAVLIYSLFLSLCLLEGLGLYYFYPSLLAYVGLSGVLHGLFSFGAIMDISKSYRSGYLLLLGVMAKVYYEQTYGASDSVTELIGARVATESHLVGVVSGVICAIVWLSYLAIKHKSRHKSS
jgi:rhomboid family GlyGly-CTERM serine protease